MNIPNYQGLMLPILQQLAEQGGEMTIGVLSDVVVAAVGMDAGERCERLPSGIETVFESRMRWALSYLEAARAIVTEAGDVVRLTEAGRTLAADGGQSLSTEDLLQNALQPSTARQAGAGGGPHAFDAKETGDDVEGQIAELFQVFYERLKVHLIQRVHAQSPAFFEELIVDLLLAMGYGGRRRDLARCLGRSGDGGVDGVVRQDSLGLDVVYVQAKRYRPGVGVPVAAVRDFAGALDAHKADKGVLVTTSHFPASAVEFARASRRRIALIDGARLASLLIRHNVAVRPQVTYELKHLDEGYFAGKRTDAEVRRA